jgi:hypothetical protein
MSEVMSPLLSAETVVLRRGFPIVTLLEEDEIVGFFMPNRYGQALSAVVEFDPMLDMVHISVQVMEMQLPSFMSTDLMQIVNGLNVELPGATFTVTFAPDDTEFDEIEVSVSHHLVEGVESEAFIAKALLHLEAVLLSGLPVIYMFLSQKIIYSVNVHGSILGARSTLSVADCMSMLRQSGVGNA